MLDMNGFIPFQPMPGKPAWPMFIILLLGCGEFFSAAADGRALGSTAASWSFDSVLSWTAGVASEG